MAASQAKALSLDLSKLEMLSAEINKAIPSRGEAPPNPHPRLSQGCWVSGSYLNAWSCQSAEQGALSSVGRAGPGCLPASLPSSVNTACSRVVWPQHTRSSSPGQHSSASPRSQPWSWAASRGGGWGEGGYPRLWNAAQTQRTPRATCQVLSSFLPAQQEALHAGEASAEALACSQGCKCPRRRLVPVLRTRHPPLT